MWTHPKGVALKMFCLENKEKQLFGSKKHSKTLAKHSPISAQNSHNLW